MKIKIKDLLAAALGFSVVIAWPAPAHPQEAPHDDPAIENQPDNADEPSIDELLGLDDDKPGDEPKRDDEPAGDVADDTNPQLTRDLDKALTGQQAADQFAQAIQEMEEVAIRLSEEADPGIDTQRLQDEIILKLEQIIASAEKQKSNQKPKPGQGKPQEGKPRDADKPGQQPGQKPGDKPGDKPGEQQGQKPGEKPGEKPGQGQGENPGEGEGEQQGNKPGGQQSGQTGSRGDVRNEELSMKDLREGEWGNLPPRLRDELAESLSETFNPVYRAATEAFYRRIAELSQEQAEEQE